MDFPVAIWTDRSDVPWVIKTAIGKAIDVVGFEVGFAVFLNEGGWL